MEAEAVFRMKQCKGPDPSCTVAEIVKASDEVSIPVLATLTNAIIAEKKIPKDWDVSFLKYY